MFRSLIDRTTKPTKLKKVQKKLEVDKVVDVPTPLLPRCSGTDLLLAADPSPTLELFPGSAVWTKAHNRIGWKRNDVHDWAEGACPEFDMTGGSYVDGLIGGFRQKTWSAGHIATECTTFSTMTGCIYRTGSEPVGTQQCLSRQDAKTDACLAANTYAENSIDCFLAGDESGAIMSLENPKGSRFWKLPKAAILHERIAAGSASGKYD